MHVIYDARVIEFQFTGLGRFAGELLFKLLDMAEQDSITYTVLVCKNTVSADSRNYLYEKLKNYESQGMCNISITSFRPISLVQHFFLSRHVNKINADIYFYPHFDLPFGINAPCIFMVHDLFPLKVPGYITKFSSFKVLYFKLMLQWGIRKAAYVFALSNTTRRDYIQVVGERFSEKVGVSLAGPIVNDTRKIDLNQINLDIPKNFLFYIGDRRPHKNIKRIVDMFVALKEETNYSGSLVLAGSTKNHGFDLDAYVNGRSDILILGPVDDGMLEYLYQKMDALVFLSKYEGLGLPVLEAGRLMKKVIVSDGGALPEFAPPWAYILPNNVDLDSALSELNGYLNSLCFFEEAFNKKFTWDIAAERVRDKFIEFEWVKYDS